MKRWFSLIAAVILLLVIITLFQGTASAQKHTPPVHPTVIYAEKHDVSPPLRDMTPIVPAAGDAQAPPLLRHKPGGDRAAAMTSKGDGALQTVYGPNAMPGVIQNFEGADNLAGVLPPDTNGDVGPNHYVQTVNLHFIIFDKSGNTLYGPANTNTIWQGFGGDCETNNDGDPVVLYDPMADRWLISQFAVDGPYYECIAISQTPDPTGSWYRYAFKTSDTKMDDYPKLGVWPDGYYMTANLFENNNWAGTGVYAFERDKMLLGQSAQMQLFELPAKDWGGMLPADLDGSTLPPAGAPNYMIEVIDGDWDPANWPNDEIHYHEFHVDWNDPNNTTFNIDPIIVNIAEFDSMPCVTQESRQCIPQNGTSAKLDAIGDRAMFRLAYRNFGDHEAMAFNHTVDAGGGRAGVRWYELRRSNTADPWSVHQQSTYAPDDGLHRWMGSIAMDAVGNMAVGYSVSSSSIFPGIRYAGRLVDDPLNSMAQGEGTIIDGGGAQTSSSNRWGDYSMLAVDPTDDCTFWFTTEYYKTTSSYNWTTRIASFKFPSCTNAPDFSLSATPDSQAVCSGDDAQYTVDVNSTGGFSDLVTLSATGNPAGTTASFSVNPVTPPGSSLLTIGDTASAAAGSSTITIEGVGGGKTHDTLVDLTIYDASPAAAPTLTSPADNATDVPLTPTFTWDAVSGAETYTLQVATDAAFNSIVHTATGITGTSYTMPDQLNMGATYYWRVAAENPCGSGAYAAPFSFTTENRICIAPAAAIPDNDAAGVSSTQTIDSAKNISDLNVSLNIPHTLVGDLIVTLTHIDTGTSATLLDRPGTTNPTFFDRGCQGDNVDATIDDEGADGNAESMCDNNPAIHGNVVGGDPATSSLLAAFDGESFGGDWQLTVSDNARGETGTLDQWCLEPVLNCAGQTNEVTGLAIASSGSNVELSWTDTNASSYKVYRAADDPYFTPDDATNLLATVSTPSYTDNNALGSAGSNYYYKVLGVDNCPPPTGAITRVAEFDFDLTPGTN